MKTSNIFATAFFAISSVFGTVQAAGYDQTGYSHDADIGAAYPRWMSTLPDNRKFWELALVGTHDSGSRYGGDIVQTQSLTIAKQLEAGVRKLDIRCRHVRNEFLIYHGFVYQYSSFDDVLSAVQIFLRSNPRETVYMQVGPEATDITPHTANNRSFDATFVDYMTRYPGLFWDFNGNNNPTLGETRGKIVLMQDVSTYVSANNTAAKFPDPRNNEPQRGVNVKLFPSSPKLPGQTDSWTIANNWQLYDKWESVKSSLASAEANPAKGSWISLSASNGAFPYFVVSGKSSPQTNAPQLLTGLVTGITANAKTYPDFPRVSCAGKLCSIAFVGTNQLTSTLLMLKKLSIDIQNTFRPANNRIAYPHVGLITTDFPGPGLIRAVINLNNP